MHQLEIQGGRTATLTRVRFTGGVMVFSEDHTRYLRELEERLMMVLKLSIFTVAQILREVHKQKLYLIDNDNLGPAADGEYQTPDTEKVAFEKWAKRRGLGHTYSYLMKWIKVGELYDDQQQFFDSREELPTRERLIFLAQHRDHPEMPRLLEASVGTPVDWKATVNEVIEQKEPDQAQEEAEAEVKQIRERIAAI